MFVCINLSSKIHVSFLYRYSRLSLAIGNKCVMRIYRSKNYSYEADIKSKRTIYVLDYNPKYLSDSIQSFAVAISKHAVSVQCVHQFAFWHEQYLKLRFVF